jgi:hypothetical protein
MAKAKQQSKVGPFSAALYNAEIAYKVISGETKTPIDISRQDYALYLIAQSLASFARALDDQARKWVDSGAGGV